MDKSYIYRLAGYGNHSGERLYVLECLNSGTRTSVNRVKFIRLLEEKMVENAYSRIYKGNTQIRFRGSRAEITEMESEELAGFIGKVSVETEDCFAGLGDD